MEKNPVMMLSEWSAKRGEPHFNLAFTVKEIEREDGKWEVSIIHNSSGESVSGGITIRKKLFKQYAAVNLLKKLDSYEQRPLAQDALVGDAVLKLCLLLFLQQKGIHKVDAANIELQNILSNSALSNRAHKLGIAATGNTHHDGSLVERYAMQIFEKNKRDIAQTITDLEVLFNHNSRGLHLSKSFSV